MAEVPTSVDGELNREILLDHCRHPRHWGKLGAPTASAPGHDPVCGDEVDVSTHLDGRRPEQVAFEGQGG